MNMLHTEWLTDSRNKMTAIANEYPNGPNRFSWAGKNFDKQHIGIVLWYHTGHDLTAKVLEWWLAHQTGDTPLFFLNDVKEKMGNLWDQELHEKIMNDQQKYVISSK